MQLSNEVIVLLDQRNSRLIYLVAVDAVQPPDFWDKVCTEVAKAAALTLHVRAYHAAWKQLRLWRAEHGPQVLQATHPPPHVLQCLTCSATYWCWFLPLGQRAHRRCVHKAHLWAEP